MLILVMLALPVLRSGPAAKGESPAVPIHPAGPVRDKSLNVVEKESSIINHQLSIDVARGWVGQDLHLQGRQLISYRLSSGEHTLVFQDGLSMTIGANQFSSDSAVVWLKELKTESSRRAHIDYQAKAYLQGNVTVRKTTAGVKKAGSVGAVDLSKTIIEDGRSMFVRFCVSGEVFVTADKREIADPRRLVPGTPSGELYKNALAATVKELIIDKGLLINEKPRRTPDGGKTQSKKQSSIISNQLSIDSIADSKQQDIRYEIPDTGYDTEITVEPEKEKKRFGYPVNISPAGDVPLELEKTTAPDGTGIATVMQRFYVWQKKDERGGLLELQADNAVIYYSGAELEEDETEGAVQAIYMSGDVLMTEGHRTIRADEIYYDFRTDKAIAINAEMRTFDIEQEMPIYVRAEKIRQIAENKFTADDITLTTSEFYLPQISLNASNVVITDTTAIDERTGRLSNSSYDAEMRNVRLKMDERTFFYWPFIRANLQKPDTPIKSMYVSYDNTWGTSVETRWYLARLLGLKEPAGTDSTLALDYFGRRGFGAGADIEYERENYFGRVLGYAIRDKGEDDLGRYSSRRDLEPDQELRGRFQFMHRQFLPYNWQLTTELSYQSDENFVESYYPTEFRTAKDRETYLHLKRLQDNWALSFLGKFQINDFEDILEETPSVEFHLTGQSFFDDIFTLYSDTEISRLRQKIGKDHTTAIGEQQFGFVSHRTELDVPIHTEAFNVVPFMAGTFGYDDRSGFRRSLVDGSSSGSFGEDKIWIGEIGVRVFPRPFWKVYPAVKSRLWDLNQLRNILEPHLTAVAYNESASVVEQRDTLNIGLSQRLQTRRGSGANQRTVDWMRLDLDAVWVSNPADTDTDTGAGPDRFIWAKPFVPLRVLSAPDIYSGDLTSNFHRFEMYGPRRDYFSADYIWRLSDTSTILSDGHYDIRSGVVDQFNIGFSHLQWPNLSYYIGSRYLKRINILGEKGSNAFTFAVTYKIDRRYTVVFTKQYDFDYDANIRSEVTLTRRYHRMNWSITLYQDDSTDRQAIIFNIWPQGAKEMGVRSKTYTGLGSSED